MLVTGWEVDRAAHPGVSVLDWIDTTESTPFISMKYGLYPSAPDARSTTTSIFVAQSLQPRTRSIASCIAAVTSPPPPARMSTGPCKRGRTSAALPVQ